jgi:2-polyprenyl-3-methyl-5-hydroxy-6-metoxy-1,4-benzoquinol methylase
MNCAKVKCLRDLSDTFMYEYHWLPGTLLSTGLLDDFAGLYSEHYGIWGERGIDPGKPVRLSGDRIREWLVPDSLIVWATAFGKLIGYAIAVQSTLENLGTVSWITQLVVHKEHRQQDVGKTILFTMWRFTDHFAWGLLSANPFAVRALEKATRRRCQPHHILKHTRHLKELGIKIVPYLKQSSKFLVNDHESRTDTKFYLDHLQLLAMVEAVVEDDKPWTMGQLPEGWEWFAFTFRDQEQITLSARELEDMLNASDKLTKHAYSRMKVDEGTHVWAKHHKSEVDLIIEHCELHTEMTVLDFGCGMGRHAIELARRGINVTGVDYLASSIESARKQSASDSLNTAHFEIADCRTVELSNMFDVGICLYDVIGSYVNEGDNYAILENLVKHIRPGGSILLSVMNLELTERIAKNWFSLATEADKLLTLPPSTTMEKTGNVFDPDYYLIDQETKIVYRKEQFTRGEGLPEELLIRDRRYTRDSIAQLCLEAGLEIQWSWLVQAGRWAESLDSESNKAKEIIVLCRKSIGDDKQRPLFE